MTPPRQPVAPLSGVRILSLTQMLMGPAGVQYLADLGASVIKVESRERGAWERNWAGADAWVGDTSVFFLLGNRNQRGLTLNLKHPRALDIVSALLERTDVLVENFRPGVMERLGLGYEQLRDRFPRLIYVSASGYGGTGPYRDRPGQDLLLQALSGFASLTGSAGDLPMPAGAAIVDQHAAAIIAMATLAALRLRDQTGIGSRIEVSLLLAALDLQQEPMGYHLNGFRFSRSESGLASGYHPAPYGVYETRDGYLALSLSPVEQLTQVDEFRAPLERFEGGSPLETRDAIRTALQPVIATQPTEYWLERLTEAGIWCGPVNDYDEVFEDPQVQHVEPTIEFEYPDVGNVHVLGLPFRIDGYSPAVRRPPRLGEHTDEILGELGLPAGEIKKLHEDGVV